MATKPYDSTYEAGFKTVFKGRLTNVSDETTEEEIKNLYAEWANEYDEDVQRIMVYHKPLAESLDSAMKQVYKDKTVDQIKIIDVGAGTGVLGVELQKLGYTNLHALDISQEMLSEAKKKNVYSKFIRASLSDQRIPEIETGEFDALICGGTLGKGHVRSCGLDEMTRIVKRGGPICFNIREGHLDYFKGKMLDLEKAGRWKQISRVTVPYFESDDLPKETFVFTYKLLQN